jgi:serine phosphatase RsbU (regulator of sigma subunit)
VFETGEARLEYELSGRTPATDEVRDFVTSYFPVWSAAAPRIVSAGVVMVEITDRKRADSERLVLLEAAEAAQRELQRAQSRLLVLAEASRRFAGLDLGRIAGNLVNLVVPVVADWAVVDVLDDHGSSHRVASAEADATRPVGEGPGVDVPLEVRGRRIGTLRVAEPQSGGGLPDLDLRLAEDLASRAAAAVDTARQFEREHHVALTLQQSLLPGELPHIPALQRAFKYVPGAVHHDVGGDWYDMVPGPDGRVSFTIGDVVGHDIDAASIMGQLRSAVRVYTSEGLAPAELMLRLNRLVDTLGIEKMATLVHLLLDPATGTAVYANAGHVAPLLIHADGSTDWLEAGNSLPVGALATTTWPEQTATLVPGDTLLLFTDGLIEERTRPINDGLERLRQVAADVAALDVDELCDRIVTVFTSGEQRDDDIALLAVRFAPGS